MTDNTQSAPGKFDFNKTIAVMIAVVTLITAIIAYLQSDAGGRDDQANRDGMKYMLEAFGQQVSGDARVNFDYNVAYQAYYEYSLLANATANRDNPAASGDYAALANEMTLLSPMLQPPYYDKAAEDAPALAKYEADTYLVRITDLMERFTAASAVKEAWDYKANTYIVHLTLLAVALFMFGLSTTISNDKTRWIFAGTGTVVAVIAVVWAAVLYARPVHDLREQGDAIARYAGGVGLAHQEMYEQAIEEFDAALADYPSYGNALAERAAAQSALGNYEAAIADYEAAVAAGDKRANTFGMLAYQYHLTGDFAKAVEWDRLALQAAPDELWVKYDLGLNLMLGGEIEEGLKVYQEGIQFAVDQVAAARAEGREAPSFLWYGLEDGADMLDGILSVIDGEDGLPPADAIADPDRVREVGEALLYQIKSTAAGLEYTGRAPEGELAAEISPFSFVVPEKDADGEVTGYSEPAEAFEYGIDEFSVVFEYANMPDGVDVLFKLYIDGVEDPSWRILQPWDLGVEGDAGIPISYAYSDTFVFDPGEYMVEMYVGYHLAQRSWFVITE